MIANILVFVVNQRPWRSRSPSLPGWFAGRARIILALAYVYRQLQGAGEPATDTTQPETRLQ